jgi:hypothetical protein
MVVSKTCYWHLHNEYFQSKMNKKFKIPKQKPFRISKLEQTIQFCLIFQSPLHIVAD